MTSSPKSLFRILSGVLLIVTGCGEAATQDSRDPFGEAADGGSASGSSSGSGASSSGSSGSPGTTGTVLDDAGSDDAGSTGDDDPGSTGGSGSTPTTTGGGANDDAGASGTNGGSSSGSSSGGTPGSSTGDAGGPTTIGTGGTVNATIVVKAGETFDGGGKRYIAGAALGDGSQSESQKPVFKLEDGARLIHVVLGSPAADGIHTHGDVTLNNIVWEDIGEDALTIKESGTVVLDGGSASNGEDKVFQINAASVFRVSNFKANDAGKFIRQNGGTTFKVEVFIDACEIVRMDEAIFRTDSDVSTVSMTNTRYSEIGDALFIGVNPSNIKESNNTEF